MAKIRLLIRPSVAPAVLLAMYACAEQPTLPEPGDVPRTAVTGGFGALQDVPAVTMDLPAEPRPWDTDDAALVAVLEEQEGHAMIGLKLPASPRAAKTLG